MKIGILSDSHDHADRVRRAMELFAGEGVELLIHCGDMTMPDTARLLKAIPTHAVVGNCDPDELALSRALDESRGQFHGLSGQLLLDGVKIAWTHGHDRRLLSHLERCGKWDYVFHGHTHIQRMDRIGTTTVINPGALQRVSIPTIGVLELASREYRTVEVK